MTDLPPPPRSIEELIRGADASFAAAMAALVKAASEPYASHRDHLHLHVEPATPRPWWRRLRVHVDLRDWALPLATGRDRDQAWLGVLCFWLRYDRES